MGELVLLLRLAVRNLFASRVFVLIGVLIAASTCFVAGGATLLDAADAAMSRSITGSITGHIQIYSARATDDLTLWGDYTEALHLSVIDDFPRVSSSLARVDNVLAIVPMGVDRGDILNGNTLDRALERLRQLAKLRTPDMASPEYEAAKGHVRQIVAVLNQDLARSRALQDPSLVDQRSVLAITRASADVFWEAFDSNPFDSLEFLENRVAPLIPEAEPLHMDFLGTDFPRFRNTFDHAHVLDGALVPAGAHGVVLSKYFYEEKLKLHNARRLDQIHDARSSDGRKIALDLELKNFIKQNIIQAREVVLQWDSLQSSRALTALQAELKSKETSLEVLVRQFFAMDDSNFDERYAFFYRELAPTLRLYEPPIGGELVIRSYLESGLSRSVRLRLYGTMEYGGLEHSPVTVGLNLIDLDSFRSLYGYPTSDEVAETRKLIAESGAERLDVANVDELFAGASTKGDTSRKLDNAMASLGTSGDAVVNAAIVLKDPSRLDETLEAIQAKADADGLKLKVVSWRDSCGVVGQLVTFAKLVLYCAVFFIFVIALVFVNNAIMTTMLSRVQEIGTMRAMGAQRGFVLKLVLLEAFVLGAGACGIGCLLVSLLITVAGRVGIPASNQALHLLFSGPALYPQVHLSQLMGTVVLVLMVTAISTLYPAALAARVNPVVAMQSDE